ncbi:MAG TPA: hypothetical protein VMT62_03715 [Syntrophorhabdaceae bacterium]|nr:hypothetical protein [Syntrophorhabdaceae bacterium]
MTRPPIELTPESFVAEETLAATDATPFVLTAHDARGQKFAVRFLVRNARVSVLAKALKYLFTPQRFQW